MTFWHSPQWREYERICQVPISRVAELTEATWWTRVLDLSKPEVDLWQDVRRSYKALIHKAERTHPIRQGYTAVDLGIAKAIHELAAERATRPIESWFLMSEWLADGCGALWLTGVTAYVYVVIWQGWAYYASGASLKPNVQHALIWRAMRDLKARGVTLFELGWLERDGDDEKDRGIAQFKRGFGGVDLPANFLFTGAQSSGLQGRSSRPASTNCVAST